MRWRHPLVIAGMLAGVSAITAGTIAIIPFPLGPGCYRDIAIDVRSGNTLRLPHQTVWLLTHDAPNIRNYGCQAEREAALATRDRLQFLVATAKETLLCITEIEGPWSEPDKPISGAYLTLRAEGDDWIDAGVQLGLERHVTPSHLGQSIDFCAEPDSIAMQRRDVRALR